MNALLAATHPAPWVIAQSSEGDWLVNALSDDKPPHQIGRFRNRADAEFIVTIRNLMGDS